MKVIGRSAGRSAVAAAAYRAGECLHDERTQTTHDYTRRSGVEAAFIVAPAHAPDWAKDTGKLWNAAEAAERKSNSQLAREWELALPAAVGAEGREAIARDFAAHLVERYGVAVGVALHAPSRHGDDRNYHAHILTTTRRMGADGLGEKTRELVDKKTGAAEISHIREYAAELINAALADAGSDERIDHRSFKDRGIEQLPTKHLGVEAAAMERRGRHSDRGDLNREIEQANQTLEALTGERGELDRHISEAAKAQPAEPENTQQPDQGGSYWQERIKAERPEGDTDQPPASPQKLPYRPSVFDELSLTQHKAQIMTNGAVKHRGLIGRWYDQAAEWVHELREGIAEKWQRFIRTNEQDNTIER
jgi:ATP-dependent exoDNAse (exonuclease V) alpha subunit